MKTKIIEEKDFDKTASELVSQKIKELQQDKNKIVNLVLATGNTQIGFLDCLSKEQGIDWQRIRIFHLDEYKGLSIDNPYSFAFYLNKNFLSKVPIPQNQINFINGANPDLQNYTKKLNESGGADIIMLGIGLDGHLAFNEPPEYGHFDSRIGEIKLTQSTIEANKPDYPDIENNPYAYSMGMADIFEGKNIFLLANSVKKAEIIAKALQGPITENVPASMLQNHSNLTVVLTTPAASLLKI